MYIKNLVPLSTLCLATMLTVIGFTDVQARDSWPRYSYNYLNWNYNPDESVIKPGNARFLRRAWSTFNDDQWRPGPPPTGFALETALGLSFPSTVVGVISPPIIINDTIYYADALGTVFARNVQNGQITDARKHWTSTMVDPDFHGLTGSIAPDLYYTAPAATDTHLWFHSSLNGRVHALDINTGVEIDFDPAVPGIQPYAILDDAALASSLGEAVILAFDANDRIIANAFTGGSFRTPERVVFVTEVNVILNDALIQGQQVGTIVALDITDPINPRELWRRATIDTDPVTGRPYGSGVSAGSGLAVDVGRRLLIGGTGQNTSVPYEGYPDPLSAPQGFVDRSDSIYAIDVLTGEFVWFNQFHNGDVFDLNNPVSTGPNRPDGEFRDADVLSPPVLYRTRVGDTWTDVVAGGSKGGIFRAMDRANGRTLWQRTISKTTGIGGIQAGAAYANRTIYVAGFEGIDDDFSDANFNAPSSTYFNAFFATFAEAFWADVEDTSDDGRADTGMRIKLYALRDSDGRSRWRFADGTDYVELRVGAALRHVSVTDRLIFVTTTSGQLFVLNSRNGEVLFDDQTVDLDALFQLGLGKPHHAGMNGGSLIAQGMVFTPYGSQNNPSGGMIAYTVNQRPAPVSDFNSIAANRPARVNILANDADPNGDAVAIVSVAGRTVDPNDGEIDTLRLSDGTVIRVVNRGDLASSPGAAFLEITAPASPRFRRVNYTVEDVAPLQIVNGATTGVAEPSHIPRRANAFALLHVR